MAATGALISPLLDNAAKGILVPFSQITTLTEVPNSNFLGKFLSLTHILKTPKPCTKLSQLFAVFL